MDTVLAQRIARYRSRAVEARTIATEINDRHARRTWEHIAVAFDEMAEHLEELIRQAQRRRQK